jgi:PAS domain S-box-containing protein
LQKRLGWAGYVVDVARDGEKGLAMYAAGSYDVVAMDQSMPIYDGLEVLRLMASGGPLPPTIMVTDAGDEKTAVEAMKLGARDYIVKDVEGGYLELLPSVIERVLQRQRLVEEKQQAEDALRESEERFRQMVELSPFPVSIIDSAGRYQYVNLKFIEVFGYTLEDIPNGKEWFTRAYPDPEYRQEVIAAWLSDLEQFGHYEIRPRLFSVTCKDGTVREILFRPVSVKGEGQFVICEDITERKRVEKALRESEDR